MGIDFLLRHLRLTSFYSSLVIKTLDEILPKDPKRRCFRLIGGVLVERTVEDVAPNLKTNLEGVSPLLSGSCLILQHEQIKKVVESLVQQYKAKETDFLNFKRDYNIKVQRV